MMNILSREDEIEYLLQVVDPFNNQRMTYSDVIHMLSSQMILADEMNHKIKIPILEKFINLNQDNDAY